MKFRKSAAMAAVSALALTATACGGENSSAGNDAKAPAATESAKTWKYPVAKDAQVEGSPAFKAAKARGKLIIGAKSDQPYLGFEDQATKKRSGFDIEIATMVAADLGFTPDQIQWKSFNSDQRETAIAQGQVDYYVGTYSINSKRKKKVGFAGPYYKAGADLLVRKDEADITGKTSLTGKKVCSIKGSTPLQEIQKPEYGARVVELGNYTDCVKQLLAGRIDAVTTDDSILKGFAAQDPTRLKVVGEPFTTELYGIGVDKQDKALRAAINESLTKHVKDGTYKKIYNSTLGLSGSMYTEPPAVNNY
ncbi:glutamate ABC transporter substrate-binding protein [Streptomyces sp. NPDC051561]|uniref:glutamate ABC transporter substrate-binding protein n=1 Tax=Streptomyces sp. NPDC051561 TaxID=3365658 RepID=UPI0037A51473